MHMSPWETKLDFVHVLYIYNKFLVELHIQML